MEIQIGVGTVGVALLVSNDYKGLKDVNELRFVHKDAANLEQVFKGFNYAVYRRENLSTADFVSCYKILAEFKYPSTCKRILVYFSGHGGDDGALIMQDGKYIKAEDMINCFKIHISNNETLAEVAKMFFFDACQGSQDIRKSGSETDWMKRMSREDGVLVAYASAPYHVSYGDDSSGSRWTNCLVQALKESKDNDDVCRVLTSANVLMRKQPNSEYQTSEYSNALGEFVYFKQEATKKVTTPLRDYTKMEEKNCQLVTHYGGKKFGNPQCVATGPNDEVVITDNGNNEVIIFDKDLKLIRVFGQGSGDSKLNDPRGVAVSHHVIAVSEWEYHVVKKYSLQGDYLSKIGSYGSGDGKFIGPVGICFNKGLLYVVDGGNYRVQVFREDNVFLRKFGFKGQFHNPCNIAVDSSDQVYVTDHSDGGGICVFSEDGHVIKKIKCNWVYAICIAPDDHIMIHDGTFGARIINVFSPTHELITKFGLWGTEKGQFFGIQGIAINSSGTIFVLELGNKRLQFITS